MSTPVTLYYLVGPSVSLLERQLVSDDDSGEVFTGFGGLSRLEATFRADEVAGLRGVSVTMTLEHSDDEGVEDPWTTAAEHEFPHRGVATVSVDTPKATLRVSWALSSDPAPRRVVLRSVDIDGFIEIA